MADTPLLSKASNGQCQATPPPPPRPAPPPQPLRCSSLANNYAGRQQPPNTSGMPNSYSMASSSIVSQQWKGHATSEAAGKKNAFKKYDQFTQIESQWLIEHYPDPRLISPIFPLTLQVAKLLLPQWSDMKLMEPKPSQKCLVSDNFSFVYLLMR